MSSKNLFDKGKSYKVLSSVDPDTLGLDAESYRNIKAQVVDKNRFIPNVDFSSASNFVRYGSAKKYYESAFDRIRDEYPYDGSAAEKQEFHNSSSYLDLYIYDNDYPTTTGYAVMYSGVHGSTADVAADVTSTVIPLGFAEHSDDVDVIRIYGGPHTSSNGMVGKTIHSEFSASNIYDSDIYDTEGVLALGKQGTRESNLKFDLSKGVTTEFWLNFNSVWPETEDVYEGPLNQVIYDQWNQSLSSSADYGRLMVFATGSQANGQNPIQVHLASGSNVWDISFGGSTFTTGSLKDTWNHLALTFVSSSTQLEAKFYVNGNLHETQTNTSITFGEVTGSLVAHLGAAIHAPSGSTSLTHLGQFECQTEAELAQLNPHTPYSGSIDEFRYWKTARTHEEIAKNYFRHVDGGTNTDIANTELGVYFKFNEGTTGVTATDSTVLDYSGRITNGTWINYPGSGARNSGSAIVSASAAPFEVEDPIIYADHPLVSAKRAELVLSGSSYDYQNNSSIYYSLPSWIIEEEEEKGGEILNLTQIMGSYFDTLHSQIQEANKLKDINYTSSSYKAYPFSSRLLESNGLFAPEIFVDASVLEQFKDQSETEFYEKDLSEIKNLIYQNIYNNLVYIYKSKGTEKSFRNVIRCYGVDDELIKINLYGNNVTHKLRDNFRSSVTKRKFADFNHPTRFAATVTHQTSSANANTLDVTYLSCSSNASTAEIEVIFPKKFEPNDENYFSTEFLSSSVFGYHRVNTSRDLQDFGRYGTATDRSLQVYAVRTFKNSKDAYFVLENPNKSIFLTSSVYQNVYDDTKWNFAIRTYIDKKDSAEKVSGSSGTAGESNIVLELYGVNTELGVVKNEFTINDSSLAQSSTNNGYLANPRRYYVGANRTNFTGSVVTNSDVKTTSLRHWNTFLDNQEVIAHAKNTNSYGLLRPYESAYVYDTDVQGEEIPRIDTLALHWNFDDVTTSDANGEFLVNDFSSGSVGKRTRYRGDFGHSVGNQYTGRGFFFPTSNVNSIAVEYVQTAVTTPPEVVTGQDMTQVLTFDDETFTRDSRTINHFFAIEKSMYQTVSEEMLNMFATIVGFNNLIGEPVNKYRQEYKDLGKLRSLFFENVQNSPDLDKYVDFYKWIDSSLSIILRQLIPASANTSEDMRTMVESHVLERSKYQHKFPTIDLKASRAAVSFDRAGAMKGAGDLVPEAMPNYRFAQAPLSNSENENTVYWSYAEATQPVLSSSNAAVNETRAAIIAAKRSARDQRRSRPARLTMESDVVSHTSRFGVGKRVIHGGVNLPSNQDPRGFFSLYDQRNANFLFTIMAATNANRAGHSLKSFVDEIHPMRKRFIDLQASQGQSTSINALPIDKLVPFRLLSGALDTGYSSKHTDAHGFQILHPHSFESYHRGGEIPMQSPFTEKFVGGFASRHVNINDGTDAPANRAETYNAAGGFSLKYAVPGQTIWSDDTPKSLISRNVVAKRPVNIENLQITTASFGSLGNYTNIREVVQLSGRTGGDSQFVRNEGVEVTSLTSSVISGMVDREMQFFSSSAHSMIERFSAPGGPETSHGSLDTATAQLTVYNAIPFRNLLVRNPLRTLLSASTSQFGFKPGATATSADYSGLANFHKVNRNTLSRIEYTNAFTMNTGSVAVVTVKDNAFVTRPIPQSDLQYAWLTSSFESVQSHKIPGVGVASRANGATVYLGYTPRDFEVSSSSGFQNAITFNAESEYRGRASATNASAHGDSPSRFSHLIRDPVSASAQTLGFPLGTSLAVAATPYIKVEIEGSRALIRYAGAASSDLILGATPGIFYNRGYVYGYSTWKQIRGYDHPVAQALRESHTVSVLLDDEQTYTGEGRVMPAQRYGNFRQFRESPIISKYKPIVQMIGDYDIASSYGNNINFYSNQELNENYAPKYQEEQVYDNVKDLYNDFVGLSYKESVYPAERNVYKSEIRERVNYENNFWHSSKDGRRSPESSNAALGDSALDGEVGLMGRKAAIGGGSRRGEAPLYSLWALDHQRNSGVDGAASGGDVAASNYPKTVGNPGELQNYKTQGHFATTAQVTASALYAHKHWVRTTASVVAPSGLALTFPSPAASGTFGGLGVGNGNAIWQAEDMAGKLGSDGVAFLKKPSFPAYDTYEEYAEEMRLIGKDFSVVPEFRISQFMRSYIADLGGDFLQNPKGLFRIYQTAQSSSTGPAMNEMGEYIIGGQGSTTNANAAIDQFFALYSNSDFLKYFDVIEEEHDGIAEVKKITLSCNALMKFQPYNGFYPSERTLQMAAQFSSSYGDFISYAGDDAGLLNARIRPFLETMYAPGVVYNSIKSGIGVPYPVMTGSYIPQLMEAGTGVTESVWAISASADSVRALKYIDFEAAIEPEKHLSNLFIHDPHPHPHAHLRLTASWNGQGDPLYRMMASNFFAECTDFFLPEGNMTTITSLPESDPRFGNAVSGNVYCMRLKMYRSMNKARTFPTPYELPQDDPTQTDLHETFTMYSRPSAFYPAISGRGGPSTTAAFVQSQHDGTYAQRVLDSYSGYNWAGTPPYYHGQAWLDIQFTATETRKYKLEEILGSIDSELNLRIDRSNNADIANDAGFYTSHATQGLRTNIINLKDVLITDGRASIKSVEYDPVTGNPTKISDDPTANHNSLVIQPKWETPMFNFADSAVDIESNIVLPTYGSESVARGMWHQFGLPPTDPDKGVFIQATDVPQEWLDLHPNVNDDNYNNGNVESLVDLLGIDQSPRRLGGLADTKEVSEAIVAVPFVQDGSIKRFFEIPEQVYKAARDGDLGPDNSVQQMIDKMTKYVFPPRMDFVTNKTINPFAMYIFEFNYTFDREDLINIWQNLSPKLKVEQKTVSVSHEFLDNELLGEALADKVQWMVFKVKKKAIKNYFSKVASKSGENLDDKRYKFEFEVAGRSRQLDYSYNWPYDFFSLVELVKIDAKIDLASVDEENKE